MTQLHPTRCLICGSGDSITVCRYHAPDDYERAVGVSEAFFVRAWVRCAECGFHYSQYSRDPAVLDTKSVPEVAVWPDATDVAYFRSTSA